MKRQKTAYWIRHTHVLGPDEYECSACGRRFHKPAAACPACGKPMQGRERKDRLDEMIEMEMILEDD